MRLLVLSFAAFLTVGCASALGDGTALPARTPASPAVARASGESSQTSTPQQAVKPFDFDKGKGHYVGGIASARVPASTDTVLAALDDVPALKRLLPRTKQAKLLASKSGTRRVELVQGNSLVTARYTIIITPSATPGELTFRLDRSRPHDIKDVYGYFKVEGTEGSDSVVTVAAAVDLGSGLLDSLFGKRVQDIILSAPHVMREYFVRQEASRGVALDDTAR